MRRETVAEETSSNPTKVCIIFPDIHMCECLCLGPDVALRGGIVLYIIVVVGLLGEEDELVRW